MRGESLDLAEGDEPSYAVESLCVEETILRCRIHSLQRRIDVLAKNITCAAFGRPHIAVLAKERDFAFFADIDRLEEMRQRIRIDNGVEDSSS